MICSVDGCSGKVAARGWCPKHYRRWRDHGDPLGGRTPPGELLAFFRKSVTTETNECIEWPFAYRGGYGSLTVDGKKCGVHILACELVNGPLPVTGMEAAHSCNNKRCFNPRHMRWATHKENMWDRQVHGTQLRGERMPCAKLTEDQVRQIKRTTTPSPRLAALFGVSPSAIRNIRAGRAWKHVT